MTRLQGEKQRFENGSIWEFEIVSVKKTRDATLTRFYLLL